MQDYVPYEIGMPVAAFLIILLLILWRRDHIKQKKLQKPQMLKIMREGQWVDATPELMRQYFPPQSIFDQAEYDEHQSIDKPYLMKPYPQAIIDMEEARLTSTKDKK